jgi:antibiotic biosynthesis monooxygenase (ABM) superfamily enzyme
MADDSGVATTVLTWDVEPGREADFEDWARGLHDRAAESPGHIDATWLRARGSRDRYYTVVSFTDEKALREWMESPVRAEWLSHLDGIAKQPEQHEQHMTGMETWFTLPGESVPPPPKWKMSIVTFCGVYPLSLLYQAAGVSLSKSWPLPLRAAVFPVVVVPVLTYLVMPLFSRMLRRWLYSAERTHPPAKPE